MLPPNRTRATHMSVMFSISASLCRTGNALMPCSGSTQEILVLLQVQDDGHASADIHGSPEPTAMPTSATQPHNHNGSSSGRGGFDLDPVPGEERAPLPAPQALILGCQLQLEGSPNSPTAWPRLAGISPGIRPIKERRGWWMGGIN